MATLVLALALLFAPDDGSAMVEAPISRLAFTQNLISLSHSFVFRGQLVTSLLFLLGVWLLLLHHAVELLPPVWLAGLDADRRYDGELRPAYHRERRRLHRDLHAAVDTFFGTYDLLVTVVQTEAAGESEAGSEGAVLEATAAATARMMCCPYVHLRNPPAV